MTLKSRVLHSCKQKQLISLLTLFSFRIMQWIKRTPSVYFLTKLFHQNCWTFVIKKVSFFFIYYIAIIFCNYIRYRISLILTKWQGLCRLSGSPCRLLELCPPTRQALWSVSSSVEGGYPSASGKQTDHLTADFPLRPHCLAGYSEACSPVITKQKRL